MAENVDAQSRKLTFFNSSERAIAYRNGSMLTIDASPSPGCDSGGGPGHVCSMYLPEEQSEE